MYPTVHDIFLYLYIHICNLCNYVNDIMIISIFDGTWAINGSPPSFKEESVAFIGLVF